MVVTERGDDWWRGTQASDLDAYLAEYAAANAEPLTSVVHAVCVLCGSGSFGVVVDDEAGVAGRVCERCDDARWMVDSAEHAADARPGEAACPCGGEVFDVAVGFACGPDGEVRWVYVALRCLADGLMGVYTDWSVDYAPTDHLLSAV